MLKFLGIEKEERCCRKQGEKRKKGGKCRKGGREYGPKIAGWEKSLLECISMTMVLTFMWLRNRRAREEGNR